MLETMWEKHTMSESDTFKFPEETLRELDELRKYAHLKTREETIGHALAFLRLALDETQSGGKLWVEREEVFKEMIPFWDERFKGPARKR